MLVGFHANHSKAFPCSVTWFTLAFLRIVYAYSLNPFNDDVTERKREIILKVSVTPMRSTFRNAV